LIDQYQITVLPIEIRFGDRKFHISARGGWDEFFQHMADRPAETAEASIPASAFQEAYSRLNRETEEILVIPGSSKLSNAYAGARAAARGFLGRCRIEVMDSMSASWGLGLLVKAAAEAAADGRPLDEIVRLIRGMLPHIYLVFFVERLDYLERRGRIGPAQALLGTMLRIKPLLLMEDGEIIPLEKVRTRTLAIEKVADFVAEFATIQQVVILRSPVENEMNKLVGELREHLSADLPREQFEIIGYDPVLACHLGPDALGVIVYEGF
jgi:DegV family protein with EDD domain